MELVCGASAATNSREGLSQDRLRRERGSRESHMQHDIPDFAIARRRRPWTRLPHTPSASMLKKLCQINTQYETSQEMALP
jgi:hypothetical protein